MRTHSPTPPPTPRGLTPPEKALLASPQPRRPPAPPVPPAPSASEVESRSTRELLTALFERKWLMLLVFSGVLAAAVFTFFWLLSPTYEAKATLIIDPNELVLPVADAAPASDLDKLTNFHAQKDILESERLAAAAVDQLKLGSMRKLSRIELLKRRAKALRKPLGAWFGIDSWLLEDDTRAASIEALAAGLKVETNVDSRAIELSYRARDADEAARTLTALIDEYQHYFRALVGRRAAGAVKYLEGQILAVNQELEEAELGLLRLRRRDVMKLDTDDGANLLSAAVEGPGAPAAGSALTITGMADDVNAQNQMKLYLLNLQEEARKLSVEYKASDPRLKNLRAKLNTYSRRLAEIPQRELSMRRARRLLDLNQEIFTLLRKNLEHARMIEATNDSELSMITVIQPARASPSAVSPAKWSGLGVCAGFGLLFAVACALIADHFDHSIRNPRELQQHLRLRALGSLRALGWDAGRKAQGSVAALLRPDTDRKLRGLLLSEESRKLFEALDSELFVTFGESRLALAFVSASRGEGASSLALLFAAHAASTHPGKRVLLIDTGSGVDSLIHRLGLSTVSSVSVETEQPGTVPFAVLASGLEGLDLMPVCNGAGAPFSPSAFKMVFERARHAYDLVVIDTPPARESRHCVALANIAGHALLVVRSGRSHREQLQSLCTSLARADVRVLGALLNFRKYPLPRWLYDLV